MDEVQRTFPVRHLGALLNQGAEARVFECTYLSKPCVVKERFSKKYRLHELDASLTAQRIKAVFNMQRMKLT